jgi:CSLREA domain-containing protein
MVQKAQPRVSWLALAALAALWPIPSRLVLADTFNVTKTLDTRDGACDSDCSLREAIIAANARPGPDTVIVPAGTYVLMQAGQGEDEARTGDLDIRDDLTLMGAGAEATRIDGNRTDRVFEIRGAAVVLLNGSAVENGSVPGDNGGGISNRSTGTLRLENCTRGGAVYKGEVVTLDSFGPLGVPFY